MASELDSKFASLTIDSHRQASEEAFATVEGMPLSTVGEGLHDLPKKEADGDGDAGSFKKEIPPQQLTILAAGADPIAMAPTPVPYTGSPAPSSLIHGFFQYPFPYPLEDVNFQTPVVDYSYMYYPANGWAHAQFPYAYTPGTQIYHYPTELYGLQQNPLIASSAGLPVMMVDAQDPRLYAPQGYASISPYAGAVDGFPTTMVPQLVSYETAGVPINSAYSPLTLISPAWVPPLSVKSKVPHKEKSRQSVGGTEFIPVSKSVSLSKGHHQLSGGKDFQAGDDGAPASIDISAKVQRDNSNGEKKENLYSQSISKDMAHEKIQGTWEQGQHYMPIAKSYKPPSTGPIKDVKFFLPNGEQYNSIDFLTAYDDAKHFIIKSYSEANVLKSIQHGVWASTSTGNKKLDEAFQDAQRRAAGKPHGCPVFLYFSVNGSGQFCGLAEMTGPVDYTRTMGFWEQHKWCGSFSVKWHIVKDLPNSQLRRIILQNNENKPVTNSRDTQEVYFQQGLEMLSIFKSYPSRSSILDEFSPGTVPQKAVLGVQAPAPLQWTAECFPKLGEQPLKVKGEEKLDTGGRNFHVKVVDEKELEMGASEANDVEMEKKRMEDDNINIKEKEGTSLVV